jgi:hypothetical protein
MAEKAYQRHSQRTITKRAGGRYDATEVWIVPQIKNTGSADGQPGSAWQHEALNADALPKIGDLSQDGQIVCVSLTPRSLDDQGTAYVDVRWQEDPLTLPAEVHVFSMSKQKPAWQGIALAYGGPNDLPPPDGPPQPGEDDLFDDDVIEDIRNSAGDRYNPPVTYEAAMRRVEVVCHCSLLWFDEGISPENARKLPSDDGFTGNWSDYLNHWNKSDYEITQVDPDNPGNNSSTTYPPGSLMLTDVRAPLVKEPYFHRLLTCIFLYNPDLWGMRLPDMGPRCLKHLGPDGKGGVGLIPWTKDGKGRGTVTDALGRPYSGAAELDGKGNQLVPKNDGSMPSALIYQWWPTDADGNLLSAEFDDLELFRTERTRDI